MHEMVCEHARRPAQCVYQHRKVSFVKVAMCMYRFVYKQALCAYEQIVNI
jgi:hypothetical protein